MESTPSYEKCPDFVAWTLNLVDFGQFYPYGHFGKFLACVLAHFFFTPVKQMTTPGALIQYAYPQYRSENLLCSLVWSFVLQEIGTTRAQSTWPHGRSEWYVQNGQHMHRFSPKSVCTDPPLPPTLLGSPENKHFKGDFQNHPLL